MTERALKWGVGLVGWLRKLWLLWAILAGVPTLALILWGALVEAPARLDTRGLAPIDRVNVQNSLRSILMTLLGGLAVLLGAVVATLSFRETSRQNRAVNELQRRGQVTERFTRAIDLLGQRGTDKLEVRIGAVYALEQIARDSAELHWPIMQVLTAYLREHAPNYPAIDDTPAVSDLLETAEWEDRRAPADVQACATVIGRRKHAQDPSGQSLDLSFVDLRYVRWESAQLEGADLSWALLVMADLRQAQLKEANLGEARLEGADLRQAQLVGAYLGGADLEAACLEGANLAKVGLANVTGLTTSQLEVARNVGPAELPHYLRPERLEQAATPAEPRHEGPEAPTS